MATNIGRSVTYKDEHWLILGTGIDEGRETLLIARVQPPEEWIADAERTGAVVWADEVKPGFDA
jgi:hypothetical protein